MIGNPYDRLNKFYSFYRAAIVSIHMYMYIVGKALESKRIIETYLKYVAL